MLDPVFTALVVIFESLLVSHSISQDIYDVVSCYFFDFSDFRLPIHFLFRMQVDHGLFRLYSIQVFLILILFNLDLIALLVF